MFDGWYIKSVGFLYILHSMSIKKNDTLYKPSQHIIPWSELIFWTTNWQFLTSIVFNEHNALWQPIFTSITWFAAIKNLGFICNMPSLICVEQSLEKVGLPFNWLTSVVLRILDYPTST